ncbi:serine hydrolase domain-containing protein [Aureivirga sp. CE67]|uniref:serine hydrolase domain-containing protein n=1 Tax=Aureivirga sp. CE67 TaxID=1788983 RepID=UPI0018CB571E|nr:serine hydrolase domain-containing protein [Aureivirga sp. CE67]
MKKSILVIVVLFSTIFQSCDTSTFNQNLKIDHSETSFLKEVDSIVIQKMNEYNIPGISIGIVKNDSIITAKGYGFRNIETKKPITENSVFHTASVSKLFTAEAIMKLVEQNKISLDDKLIEIIPEIKYDDERVKEITIKNLLNHTSGLPDISNYHWNNNNQSENSLKEYVLELDLDLDSKSSTEYQYSNLGYDILGYVIEKASGTTFEDFVQKNILNKNKMNNSDFRYFNISDSLKTSPHSKSWITKSIYIRDTYPYTREHAASSTLNTSTKDLNKWMISFLQNLENSDSKDLYTSMINSSFSSYPYIGLGFQLNEINSKKLIGHYGGDKGFRSYLIMIPEEKIGIVVLGNCDYNEDFRQEIIHPIAKLMLNE